MNNLKIVLIIATLIPLSNKGACEDATGIDHFERLPDEVLFHIIGYCFAAPVQSKHKTNNITLSHLALTSKRFRAWVYEFRNSFHGHFVPGSHQAIPPLLTHYPRLGALDVSSLSGIVWLLTMQESFRNQISSLENLHSFNAAETTLTAYNLKSILKKNLRKTLTQLNIRGNGIHNLPSALGKCHQLKILNIAGNGLGRKEKREALCNAILEKLAPTLEELDLSSNSFMTLPKALQQGNNIRKLSAAHNCLGGSKTRIDSLHTILEKLAPTLTELDLSHNGFKMLPLALQDCQNLQVLCLQRNVFTTEKRRKCLNDILALVGPSLTDLDLSDCGLKEVPEVLKVCKNLNTLKIQSNTIGKKRLSRIALNAVLVILAPSLTHLDISDNYFPTLPEALQQCNNLKTLSVRWNFFYKTPQRIARFKDMLERLPATLTLLDMRYNDFGALILPDSLQRRIALKTLSVLQRGASSYPF